MAKPKEIVKLPAKVLRGHAKDVPVNEILSSRIQGLISDMKEALKNTPDGVGLAAPQVGEPLRIFIVSEEAEEIDRVGGRSQKGEFLPPHAIAEKPGKLYEERAWKYYVFINPVLKNNSRRKLDGPEGCLSVPGKFGNVARHEKITVVAYDESGKKFIRGAAKFFARVMQHELDHLEGTLFIDKAHNVIEVKRNDNKK
ncbi:MAG: Peptide deformylase [Parcubacteria group bacterium GW2011_GWA2_45_30]|nr:MAG: Peptide deformylase [Parcubacteria group bacterium GW2011_GWA2_45_30]